MIPAQAPSARVCHVSARCCRRAAMLKMKPYVTYFSTSHINLVLEIDVWGYQARVVDAKKLTFVSQMCF